jgi:hypothetical protein
MKLVAVFQSGSFTLKGALLFRARQAQDENAENEAKRKNDGSSGKVG